MTSPALPCFTCTLPDCDDTDRRCGLRQSLSVYRSYREHGMPVPDDVRRDYGIAYTELYGAANSERGVRRRATQRAGQGGAS